ncbi:DUF6126 family protein [Streptomyces sp. NPDC059896]|uniref:DUF6126 family protein n=1 Tax=Streptomyces sp. NPDC059896 TaxID=3346993 RepID=UPI003646C058
MPEPENPVSENAVQENAVPENVAPENPVPENAVPGHVMKEEGKFPRGLVIRLFAYLIAGHLFAAFLYLLFEMGSRG